MFRALARCFFRIRSGQPAPSSVRPARKRSILPLLFCVCIVSFATQGWSRLEGSKAGETVLVQRPVMVAAIEESNPEPGTLQVGAYVTVIDDLNLLSNQFGAEFFLWTRWSGATDENPSARLAVLNAPSNNDVDRFELLEQRRLGDSQWSLYKVRCRVSIPWSLEDYPFDKHKLLIRLGMNNPLISDITYAVDKSESAVDPGFFLYDWSISPMQIDASSLSLRTNLGLPQPNHLEVSIRPVIDIVIPIQRRSELSLLSSFLGDFLAIGLCVLALLIRQSRDDLILGAVFAAAGTSVFLAGMLPVSALAGFAGQFQVIIYVGIVYVIIADELLDRVFSVDSERVISRLRPWLLPSYLIGTILGIYLITPVSA